MLCGSARQRGVTRMPVVILSMLPASTACTIDGVGAVGLHQRERERVLQRMLRGRFRNPRPRLDGAAGSDVDELVERLAGVRVVLERRHEHLAVAAAHADDPVLAQAREKRADDRSDRARVRELERALGDSGHAREAKARNASLSILPIAVTGRSATTSTRSGDL